MATLRSSLPTKAASSLAWPLPDLLKAAGIYISMVGEGCWRDNVLIKRLRRTIKYEEVYLRAYESVSQAKVSLGRYIDYYSAEYPHLRLDRRTPDSVYFNQLPLGGSLTRMGRNPFIEQDLTVQTTGATFFEFSQRFSKPTYQRK
jgi:hypothetical protein